MRHLRHRPATGPHSPCGAREEVVVFPALPRSRSAGIFDVAQENAVHLRVDAANDIPDATPIVCRVVLDEALREARATAGIQPAPLRSGGRTPVPRDGAVLDVE